MSSTSGGSRVLSVRLTPSGQLDGADAAGGLLDVSVDASSLDVNGVWTTLTQDGRLVSAVSLGENLNHTVRVLRSWP
jgi:hypothetical protein